MLALGTLPRALHTASWVGGTRIVARIGAPLHPDHRLEESLLAARSLLTLTAVQVIPTAWVLARRGPSHGQVLVDEVAFGDCGDAMLAEGLKPQIVPAPLEERVGLARDGDSLVIDRSELPAGFQIAPGHPRAEWNQPTWFGRIERVEELPLTGRRSGVWLAFGPHEDRTGTLREALTVFSDRSINLTHLRSVAISGGSHAFFAAFLSPDDHLLSNLLGALNDQRIAHRVLALFPYDGEEDSVGAVDPVWGNQ